MKYVTVSMGGLFLVACAGVHCMEEQPAENRNAVTDLQLIAQRFAAPHAARFMMIGEIKVGLDKKDAATGDTFLHEILRHQDGFVIDEVIIESAMRAGANPWVQNNKFESPVSLAMGNRLNLWRNIFSEAEANLLKEYDSPEAAVSVDSAVMLLESDMVRAYLKNYFPGRYFSLVTRPKVVRKALELQKLGLAQMVLSLNVNSGNRAAFSELVDSFAPDSAEYKLLIDNGAIPSKKSKKNKSNWFMDLTDYFSR